MNAFANPVEFAEGGAASLPDVFKQMIMVPDADAPITTPGKVVEKTTAVEKQHVDKVSTTGVVLLAAAGAIAYFAWC